MDNTGQPSPIAEQHLAQNPPVQEPSSPRKSPTMLMMSLGGITLLALGLIGGYFIANNKTQTSEEISTKSTDTSTTQPPPTIDPTEKWSTYSSADLALTFKYPPTLEIEETKATEANYLAAGIKIIPKGKVGNKSPLREINIWLKENPQLLTALEWFLTDREKDPRLTGTPAEYTESVVNNYKTVTNLKPISFDHIVVSNYIFANKDKAYYVTYDDLFDLGSEFTYPQTIEQATFDQILSTLTFL